MTVTELLKQYQDSFAERRESLLQSLAEHGLSREEEEMLLPEAADIAPVPERAVERIPTVDGGWLHASDQLRERFAFAGSWRDISEHMLDAQEMAELPMGDDFQEWLETLRCDWEDSAPAQYPDSRLSLLAVSNEEDGDYTLLVWTHETDEPEVWRYSGQNEQQFPDLMAWLAWLND